MMDLPVRWGAKSFGQKCTNFENILKKGTRLCAIIACNELLEKALYSKVFENFSSFPIYRNFKD